MIVSAVCLLSDFRLAGCCSLSLGACRARRRIVPELAATAPPFPVWCYRVVARLSVLAPSPSWRRAALTRFVSFPARARRSRARWEFGPGGGAGCGFFLFRFIGGGEVVVGALSTARRATIGSPLQFSVPS